MYPIHRQSEIHTIIVVFLSPRSTMFLCFLRRYFPPQSGPPSNGGEERERKAQPEWLSITLLLWIITEAKLNDVCIIKNMCTRVPNKNKPMEEKKAQKIFQTPKKVRGAEEWNELLNNSFRFLLLLFYIFIRHTHGIWVAAASGLSYELLGKY